MTSAAHLSTDELARFCATETEKFNRREPSDTQFCFELFRRALADGAPDAFTSVYRVYERQVQHWVVRHPQFTFAQESPEYFASQAWSKFFFALRGAKFAGFASLPQVLRYLRQCTFTAVTLYMRDQQRGQTISLEQQASIAQTPDLMERVDAEQIASRIAAILPNERDRLLAHCVFVEQLRPREIMQAYPGYWADERAISIDLYRIRRILRHDYTLRQLLGVSNNT